MPNVLKILFSKAAAVVAAGLLSIGLVSAPAIQTNQLAAQLPNSPALVDTYLASNIGTTDTSMTLAKGTTQDGVSLSGFMCFTIDVNSPQLEYVCGTASGTAVTSMMRGVGFSNPNTTSTALAFVHRRFASVQSTDYPTLQLIVRQLNGVDSIGSSTPMSYAAGIATSSFTTANQIIDKGYADALSFAGVANGNSSTKGIYQEATTAQLAAGTLIGSSGADLALTTRVTATSSAANSIPVLNASGTIPVSMVSGTAYTFTNAKISIDTTTSTATTTDNFNLLPAGVVQMYATSTAPTGWLLANGQSVATSSYPRLFAVIGYTYGGSTSTFSVPDFRGRQPVGSGQDSLSVSVASSSISGSTITIPSSAVSSSYAGAAVTLTETSGSLPAPLATGTTYYITNVSGATIQLATTTTNAANGSQIPLTTTGSSTMVIAWTFNSYALGSQGGQENHVQTQNELANHTHSYPNDAGAGAPGSGNAVAYGGGQGGGHNTSAAGSNAAMNVEDPYLTINFIIKY